MSSHEDNIHNKKLKDLLGNSENQPMDDFEKEAMEGFSTLKNEEEIFELKASLDKRIDEKLFTKEKKSDKAYWYAAAGLVFLIGFSIYFIQNNLGSDKEDLAINNQPQPMVEAELIQKSIAADTVQFKPAEAPVIKPETSPAMDTKKTVALEKDAKGTKSLSEEVPASAISANYSAGQMADQAAPPENRPVAAPSPPKSAKRSEEDINSQDMESDKIVLQEVAASSAKADRVQSIESKKRKKEGKEAKEEESAARDFVRSSPAAASSEPEPVSAYYEGGPGALNESLRNKLEAKNLLHNFNATVSINEKKKIQKVILSNTGELTKEQQKEIIGTIKSLDKFNFSNPAAGKFVAEYKIVFRP